MTSGEGGRCPVCRARFRGSPVCSRCGADLAPLVRIAARAHALRVAARRALLGDEPSRALELATAAHGLQRSETDQPLRTFARFLLRLHRS